MIQTKRYDETTQNDRYHAPPLRMGKKYKGVSKRRENQMDLILSPAKYISPKPENGLKSFVDYILISLRQNTLG